MSKCSGGGRSGNKFFRNLAASAFAKKFNLYIDYKDREYVDALGFKLFCGDKKYDKMIILTDNNYVELYEKNSIDFNCDFQDYFQSTKISHILHEHLKEQMDSIVLNNKYKSNYNSNSCFIHVRLGDVAHFNPGFRYYDQVLSKIQVDTIYLSTDTEHHEVIHKLLQKYSNIQLMKYSLPDIVLFGSTNKHVILSHGTFSGMIGYMSFYSNIYFIKESNKTSWDYQNNSGRFDIFKGHSSTIGEFEEIDTDKLL